MVKIPRNKFVRRRRREQVHMEKSFTIEFTTCIDYTFHLHIIVILISQQMKKTIFVSLAIGDLLLADAV